MDRQLVRTLIGPLPLGELATLRVVRHLRSVRLPEGAQPKDAEPQSLTFDQALVLLAERAQRVAADGGRRPARGRTAARKTGTDHCRSSNRCPVTNTTFPP